MEKKEKKKSTFWSEFKAFIARGNVMDMAVGVIVGAAFKAIIDSLVNDLLMPIIGIFVKTDSFASLTAYVGGAEIHYGAFIAAIVNFLIMAFVLFLIVRTMNKVHEKAEAKKKAEEPAPEPAPAPAPTETELLAEILETLKEQKK